MGRKKARAVPLPSVSKRIQLAVSIALKADDIETSQPRFFGDDRYPGLRHMNPFPRPSVSSWPVAEIPVKSVMAGANVGFDTDTIASMAGALSGALNGFDSVPMELFKEVQRVNQLDFEKVAEELENLII